jgi:hypothetical protein
VHETCEEILVCRQASVQLLEWVSKHRRVLMRSVLTGLTKEQ